MEQPEFPPDMPEELQEHFQHIHERHMMHHEANAADLKRFFDELTMEQLATFRSIMSRIVNSEDISVAAFYQGVCMSVLTYKHDVCLHCGEIHDVDAMLHQEMNDPT